ncbi:MAG: tRNA (adenosine(37)-N6)-threonylcarbamoyltransferase complex dimerization subunit type 1 TsaB [Lachnospiraceae bacterium]|nr:tRNA (adenosine(37)-N6)-threonylcarbamoyltransferase complex dimerization subunit type 1 TsaB [Lachnospiraceae bacterium]MBR3036042.1 tRNA (adenosine(37)-N6)-threonylcarbamoyltransferase complex dimerization subunit type 1 TsaB [Lachnospiraceae bacterium]
MKILGIESASNVASVALVEDEKVLASFMTNHQKTHSETLLPMIEQITRLTDTDLSSIDAIAVSAGPGSFTGLRIGASTGKGLAFALDRPMIAVPTLDAMAYGCFSSACILCPILDARRSEVYTGLYHFEGTEMITDEEGCALPITEQVQRAQTLSKALGRAVLYLGDGLPVYEEKIRSLTEGKAVFAASPVRFQRAEAVAALGLKLYEAGKISDAVTFEPIYLRKSQAERERLEAGLSIEPKAGEISIEPREMA